MRIRDIYSAIIAADKIGPNEANGQNKTENLENPGFLEKLGTVRNLELKNYLSALQGRIQDQGRRLSDKMDISDLRAYKKLISEFLSEAVSNSHRFAKENYLDRRGRHKVYAIVKKVNESLDNLTEEFMKEEKDRLKVLQSLDDIRGLLLDIVM